MNAFAELHDELRNVARDALDRPLLSSPGLDAGAVERLAVDLGWTSLEVPETHGGAGATFAETAVVLGELGRAAAPGRLLGSSVMGVGALLGVEPTEASDGLLEQVGAGEVVVAVALAPSGDAPHVVAPFALRNGRLHGAASHVLDAAGADRVLLVARREAGSGDGDGCVDGESVIVSVAAADLAIAEVPLVDTTRRVGSVVATEVAVDDADVWSLGADSSVALDRLGARLSTALALDALGVSAAVLDGTVAYVTARRQFDRPIGSFQAVKHQLADVLVSITVGTELANAAVAAIVDGDADVSLSASRAISYCTEAAVHAAGVAMQLHGGIGYTWESGVHTFLKRALVDRTFFGSPDAHRRQMGERYLGDESIARRGG